MAANVIYFYTVYYSVVSGNQIYIPQG